MLILGRCESAHSRNVSQPNLLEGRKTALQDPARSGETFDTANANVGAKAQERVSEFVSREEHFSAARCTWKGPQEENTETLLWRTGVVNNTRLLTRTTAANASDKEDAETDIQCTYRYSPLT